jgi:micrococcal nuclease
MPESKNSKRSQALTAQRYKQLRHDVQQLMSRSDAMSHKNRVGTLWRLGRRITKERIAQGTGYHNTVLRDLCRDTRVSLRNLQYAVVFVRAYPERPKQPLSWGHYRLLLDRPTDAQRAHYEARTRDENLAVHTLARLIANDQRAIDPHGNVLKRPTTASYLYAATVVNIVDGDTLDLRIDLGFHTERIGRFRLADINTAELPTRRGDSRIAQGSQTTLVAEARAARDFMFNRLLNAKTIVVKTQRTDQHGRYVTHLFYSAADVSIDTCFREGTYLNAELIEAGHAVKVPG